MQATAPLCTSVSPVVSHNFPTREQSHEHRVAQCDSAPQAFSTVHGAIHQSAVHQGAVHQDVASRQDPAQPSSEGAQECSPPRKRWVDQRRNTSPEGVKGNCGLAAQNSQRQSTLSSESSENSAFPAPSAAVGPSSEGAKECSPPRKRWVDQKTSTSPEGAKETADCATRKSPQNSASSASSAVKGLKKETSLEAIRSQIKSLVLKNLFTSPLFARFYVDLVISNSPNSNAAKILRRNYKKILDRISTMANTNSCTHNKGLRRPLRRPRSPRRTVLLLPSASPSQRAPAAVLASASHRHY